MQGSQLILTFSPLTIHILAGILNNINKKNILPALSENSMQATANSDPKRVEARSSNVSAERIRERLTEESAGMREAISQVSQVGGPHASQQP